MTDFKKTKPKLGFVNARVNIEDLALLKAHQINISELIRDAISKESTKLKNKMYL